MKNAKIKRLIAIVTTFTVMSTYVFTDYSVQAYTDDKNSNVDVSNSFQLKDGVTDNLSKMSDIGIKGDLELTYKAKDEVNIIIELENKSLLDNYILKNIEGEVSEYVKSADGKKVTKNLLGEQEDIVKKIKREVSSDIKVENEYTVVLNGISVKAKFEDYEAIKNMKGVKNAFIATVHQLPPQQEIENETKMIHSSTTIGAVAANDLGYTGEETVVAVLDTGIDINHEAFKKSPDKVKYSEQDIKDILDTNTLNAKGNLYKSEKIPFAYDYADRDDDPTDANNHGTHVAGTVAANGDKIKGVAPDAQLMIMKVFSSKGGGASDTNILAALDDAVALGADSINMSLGSAAGFTSEANEVLNQTYNRVDEAGISLICAAGNDISSSVGSSKGDLPLISNPDNGIVGSPSTYDAATSIASINNTKTFASYFLYNDLEIRYTDTNTGTSVDFTTLSSNEEIVVVPGIGSIGDFESVDVENKIALIKRGTIAFTEKEANAKLYGAKGVIIYNNIPGELISMQTSGELPMVFISLEDGETIKSGDKKTISVSSEYAGSFDYESAGLMSDFSSWGVTPDLKLKPEITAPGGNIYSSLPGSTYGSMSGTSMASPHAAGAVALLRQYVNERFENLSNYDEDVLITNLLMSTANIVLDNEEVAYSPRNQGAGLINVKNAIQTKAYLTTSNGKPKAELGDSKEGVFSFDFDIKNISDEELKYTIDTTALTEKIITKGEDNFFAQKSRELDDTKIVFNFNGVDDNEITVGAGESKKISVTMTLTDSLKDELEICENGTFIDGFVTLVSNNSDNINLNIPFLGFYGEWNAAPIFDSNIFDGEDAIMYDTALGNFNIYTGSGYYLGANLFTDEMIVDENKIAIGSNITGEWVVSSLVGLLRSAEDVTYTVTNSDNKVVYERKTGQQSKSFYYSNGGFTTYSMDEVGWDAVDWDNMRPLPQGDYTYKISVESVMENGKKEELTFPITIDSQSPEFIRKENFTVDGKDYLKVVVKDNHYIQAVQLNDYKNEPISDIIPVDYDERGAEYEIVFDLANLKDKTAVKIAVVDYANNMFFSKDFGPTEEGILPESVTLNQNDIAILAGNNFQMSATVLPESADNKKLIWSSSNAEVASIDENGLVRALKEGEATISVSTFNGKTSSTKFHVAPKAIEELKEPYEITQDGEYRIPENLINKIITIKNTAQNVILNGHQNNGVSNPYKGISVVAEGNVNLTLKDVNINRTDTKSNVIDFNGEKNTLSIVGENKLTSNVEYSPRAMINIIEGKELEILGSGKLDINPGKSNYGACIGGSATNKVEHNSGKIIISGGDISTITYGAAAAIGGAGEGIATDIRIKGGKVTAINEAVSYIHGAAIGSSSTAYNYEGKSGIIRISGGEVIATTSSGGAAIGDCKSGNTPYNIIISGGIVNASTTSTDEFSSGAAIGGGVSSRGNIKVTILGGIINANSSSSAAAIGGGADNRNISVSIEGGTVSASSTGKGAAIGNGYYGQNAEIRIFKGSVKAVATGADVQAIGNGFKSSGAKIIGENGTTPFKVAIPATNITSVKVDGVDWKVANGYTNDDNIYLYLTNSDKQYIVEVSSENNIKTYLVTVKNGNVIVNEAGDIIAPKAPEIKEENGLVTITALDEDTETLEYSLDGQNWIVYEEPVKVEEKAIIYARAIDSAGNISEVISYKVPDRTAPKAPKIKEENGLVTITALDEDTETLEYSLDGQNWISYEEPVKVEEKATIYARAIDSAGNVSGIISFTVADKTAPKAPEIKEENGLVTILALDEDTETLEYSLDGQNWTSYEEPVEVEEKATIYARAIDSAGNISGVTSYKVPDRTAPKAPEIKEENGLVTIVALDEDTETLEYSLDGQNWIDYEEPVEVEEKATIYARAIDSAGNISEVISYKVPDRTAPKAPEIKEENGLVTILALDEDTEILEYSLDGQNWIDYEEPVKVEEKAIIFARAIDSAGNISAIISYKVPDRTAPKAPEIKLENGTVTIISSDSDTIKIEYSYDRVGWIKYNEPIKTNGGTIIYARTIDEAGNISDEAELEIPEISEVSKISLIIAIEEADKITEEELSKVVPVVVKEFRRALKNAKDIVENKEATQEEVDKAFKELSDVMQMLSFFKGNKDNLINLVEKINKLEEEEYIAATWINLEKYLSNANDIINDENALEEEVAKSYSELLRAFLQLRLKPNKDKLEDLINKANTLVESEYTSESWSEFISNLDKARKVYSNDEATAKDINEVAKALEESIASLVKTDNDKVDNNDDKKDDDNSETNTSNKPTEESKNETKPGNDVTNNKLPQTGAALSGGAVVLLGLISLASGIVVSKKKDEEIK